MPELKTPVDRGAANMTCYTAKAVHGARMGRTRNLRIESLGVRTRHGLINFVSVGERDLCSMRGIGLKYRVSISMYIVLLY